MASIPQVASDAAAPDAATDWPGNFRLLGRTLWLAGALLVCLPPHALCRLFDTGSPFARIFLRWSARACGARVETIGTPLRRDVFFVANHLSWLDINVIGGLTGTAFVAQDKIADWPVIGTLARLNHTVFVSRTDRLAVGTQIAELRAALDQHQPITLFPEGTTTDGRSLLPFRAPLFAVLLPTPGAARPPNQRALMIQPVLLDYDDAGKDLAWIGEETALPNALRVLRRAGSFGVRAHFLPPFDPGEHPHRKAISAESRRRIEAALAATLGNAPSAAAWQA